MEVSPTYDALNKAWKSTAKILFGQELGELRDYEDWLKEYVPQPRIETSALSKKPVSLAVRGYADDAGFIGFDEIDFSKKFSPLSINEMKDIDGIVEALQERFCYTGNIILGNSKFIENSSNVIDSYFVLNSGIVTDSKYIGYSDIIRKCEYIFGVHGDAQSSFTVKSSDDHRGTRCFECYTVIISSDCYYSMRCQDSLECMFCFGARSKKYAVGNLELPKAKYLAIKKKLLFEIADILKRDKRIFSLLEIMQGVGKYPLEIKVQKGPDEEVGDKGPIEKAFSKTTSLILGKKLEPIDSYADFLKKNWRQRLVFKSPLSGKRAYLSSYMANLADLYDIKDRFVTEEEIMAVGRFNVSEKTADSLKIDLDFLVKSLHPIAYSAMCDVIGTSRNLIDCAIIGYAEDCYACDACVYAKKCGYSFWPRESDHIFGSWCAWDSSFAIKAFHSEKVSRVFEVDNCKSCADLYFSHNCENVREGMFCFNVKNLNYSIGNAPLPKDQFGKFKSSVLEQICEDLEKKKSVKWDIYNIGGRRKT